MKTIANGLTRHRFWGEYSAHIVLEFESKECALACMPLLNDGINFGDFKNAGGGRTESSGWHHVKDSQGDAAKCLFLEVADPALTQVVDRLVSFGAEKKLILSLARSIDYGENFDVFFEIPDPNGQQEMKFSG